MGRPNGTSFATAKDESKKTDSIKAKRSTPSGSHLGKSNYYKGDFQKALGNANTGRGYTLVQKKRLLSRFKKKMMRKKSHHDESSNSSNKSLCINPNTTGTSSMDETLENKTLTERANNSTLNGSTFSLFKRKKKKAKETNVKRVEIDYNAIQEERRKKAAELQANIAEHDEVVARNIRKRKNVTKRLSQRTKRGQPIMANRLELILDKIKKN